MHYIRCFFFVTRGLFAQSKVLIPMMIILTIIIGFIELLGISVLIPILEILTKGDADSQITEYVRSFFKQINLELTINNILILAFAIFLAKLFIYCALQSFLKYIQTVLILSVNKNIIDSCAGCQIKLYNDFQKSGAINNILNQELDRYDGLIKSYCDFILNIAFFIAYNIIILINSWMLFIIFLVSIFVFLGGFGRIFRKDFSRARQLSSMSKDIIGKTTQFLQTLHYTKSVSLEKRLSFHIKSSMDLRAKNILLSKINSAIMKSLGETLAPLGMIAFLYISFLIYQKIEPEILVLALASFRMIQTSARLQQGAHRIATGSVALNNIQKTLKGLKHGQEPQARLSYPAEKRLFSLDNISFGYKDQTVLHNISLTLQPNDYIGIVGPSGAGKTTLLLILLGIVQPIKGMITYGGIPYYQLDLSALRHKFGYVPQDLAAFDDSLLNNITLWDDSISYEEARSHAVNALKMAQGQDLIDSLDRDLGERGMHLSGGQRQRVALARELYRKPQLLILDEAMGALDSLTESSILEELNQLRQQMTIVTISHRLSSVRNCDTIYVLQDGTFIESGHFNDLVANHMSVFHAMWNKQQKGTTQA